MNNIREIKTGVIGVGSMGKNHARVYSEISNLVGVADLDSQQGQNVASNFGCSYFENYEDLLPLVDAVSISVPTKFHLQVCKKVARAGVHILVEKPLAGNYNDAKALSLLEKENDLVIAVGHIERHNEIVKEAKSQIKSGVWGDLNLITARRFSPYPLRIIDVGVLFDLAIHDVDVISYLAGSTVESVYVSGGQSINSDHEDFVIMIMNFCNGIKGVCETNWLSTSRLREIDFFGNVIHANLNYVDQCINLNYKASHSEKESVLIKVEKKEPLVNELEDFLDCISSNRKPLVTVIDGLNAVQIIETGLKSLKTKSVVRL